MTVTGNFIDVDIRLTQIFLQFVYSDRQ